MPRATFVVELDIDEDGTYGTDVTSDVMDATIFRGRSEELEAAREGKLTVILNNSGGLYAPKSSTVVTENSVKLTTLVPIRVRTTAPSTTPQFTGFITDINVDPTHKKQRVKITATDSMTVLQRAVISQRLVQGQPTGVIIHRLMDAVEGELISNTSFDEDLTGYTEPSVDLVRQTTTVLEGLAAMDVESFSLISEGSTHFVVTSVTSPGDRVTFVYYVRSRTAGTTTPFCKAEIWDNDVGFTIGSVVTITDDYQQVEVTGTYGSSSTAREVVLTTHGIDFQAGFLVGATHLILTKNSIPRNVDGGRTDLSFYGPYRRKAMSAIEEVRNNELGGLFYIDGGGTAVFEERTKRLGTSGTAAVGTIDELFWKIKYDEKADDRFSKIIFNHAQFDIGAPATFIWTLELPKSRPLSAGGTEVIEADYGFIAKDVTKPVANTDYRINTQADGGGSDQTGSVTFTWVPYGEGARFQFVNTSSITLWIIQLAVRATPIRFSSDEQIQEHEPLNPPSLTTELEHSFPINDHPGSVKNFAEFIGDHFVTQKEDLTVTLRPRTTTILTQMLDRKISDRVKLVNDDKSYAAGFNGDFYIESIRHRIRKGAFLHETTWVVSPVHNFYWILDIGELDDIQTVHTTTAPAP